MCVYACACVRYDMKREPADHPPQLKIMDSSARRCVCACVCVQHGHKVEHSEVARLFAAV